MPNNGFHMNGRSFKHCAIASGLFKLLLFPAYRSTDFEVHRNWLAITHSLPVSQWYINATSKWTLDYPPFFAWFEYVLSQFARFFDSGMLDIQNLEYASQTAIHFQRSSVIFTELLLYYALNKYIKVTNPVEKGRTTLIALSIFLSPGLLIIDHIHFQYNGFLFGLFILSLSHLRHPSTYLQSSFEFSVLLCFKHIFLYIAPAYFVFLLRSYCLKPDLRGIEWWNTIKLGSVVISVFAAAFGPFVYLGQCLQLLSRLFPFTRGLCHAYWAPNIWALYSFLDRCLIPFASTLNLPLKIHGLESNTRGIVGNSSFAVLPDITPGTSFIITLSIQFLVLIKLFFRPKSYDVCLGAITLCAFASFLTGYHVHEKAILNVIIPFSLLALTDRRYLCAFKPLAVAGYFSLFPLIFTPAEIPIQICYTILWQTVFMTAFEQIVPQASNARMFFLDRFEALYLIGFLPLIVYVNVLHQLFFASSYEFLPLMFMSIYCSLGVISSFFAFLYLYLTEL